MRFLTPLANSSADVFAACTSRVKSPEARRVLQSVVDYVEESTAQYARLSDSYEWFRYRSSKSLDKSIKSELLKNYTGRMVPKNSPGRNFYDAILGLSANGVCPYCSVRPAATIDHYLSKSQFPELATDPKNLIPACRDCNSLKSEVFPSSYEDQILHPYFDHAFSSRWLYARINSTTPANFEFYVRPPEDWPSGAKKRVHRHFEAFELGQLCSVYAAEEAANISHELKLLHDSAGSIAVQQHLNERERSCRKIRQNSWQIAFYDACKSNKWFCDGGFII